MENKEYDPAIETAKAREYYVVKSNKLINNVSRRKYELSVIEQRAIAYIISQIKPPEKPSDQPQYRYIFDIKKFCEVCGISYDSGKNYANVKAALTKLSENGFWIDEGDSELYFQWIYSPRIYKKSGRVSIRISEDVMPYLWNLSERFTKYQLYQVLCLKSAFSIAFYELFKCNLFRKTATFAIDDLKKYLGIEGKYSAWRDLRRNVIEPAVDEINKYTDIDVTWQGVKHGRAYDGIKFDFRAKEQWQGYEAYRRTVSELNGVPYDEGQGVLFE